METKPFNDHSYEEFLSERRIMGTKCRRCGDLSVPPRVICASCHGTEMEWAEFKGEGRLAAFTSIFIAPPSMAEEGFGRNNPYVSGVVELEEGPRVVARIIDVDARSPETIKVGLPVKADFVSGEERGKKKTALVFRP